MNKSLSPFNWSLKKALDTQPDSFVKARVNIVFVALLFSLLKCLIVVGIAIANNQWLQVNRAAIAFMIYIVLLKCVLSRPEHFKLLAHIMLVAGVLIVWSNMLFYSQSINLVTIQFIFMIILCSFYALGSFLGLIYSAISALPIILVVAFRSSITTFFSNSNELASPGPEIIVILNFITIIIAHYLFYTAFDTNIGEKEKLNKQLQLSIIEATRLADSKSNFLSTMSHELRTPLNSVIGMSELLLQNNRNKDQEENLQILQSSSSDLLSLVNNVLDFNKTDAHKLVLESTPFHLAELIRDKCSSLKLKATDKKLDFILDIDKRLEKAVVVSDSVRLSQVIYNLVSNAIKFTNSGSVTIKLECLQKQQRQAEVLFSVIDTGIGIHPDRHKAIFELFTQAESDTTRKYGGTGLGLAIVKQILALFGSRIQLESTPGNGSNFSFTIPFNLAEDATALKTTTTTDKTSFSHLKVLIAEDNSVNRILLKKQMEKLSLVPLIVENGQYAYDACLSDNYDVIFLDLSMPVLDGYETIKQIRALADPVKANVPIIAFTASVAEQDRISGAGFNDMLYKPASINDFKNKLEKITAFSSSQRLIAD